MIKLPVVFSGARIGYILSPTFSVMELLANNHSLIFVPILNLLAISFRYFIYCIFNTII